MVRRTQLVVLMLLLGLFSIANAAPLTTQQVTNLAKEAYIYGFPLVENYKTMYAYAIDKNNPQYKSPFNQIHHLDQVFTPKDTTIATPNSDTLYSFVWADLRTQPLLITVPKIEDDRYYSIQLIDLYTYNFAYIGTRTTGNAAGNFLLIGPHWKGIIPKEIKKVFHADTDFVFLIYRTQLFNPKDIDNVRKIQSGYKVQSLNELAAKSKLTQFPVFTQEKFQSIDFFNYLNFILQYCPPLIADKVARDNIKLINFNALKSLSPANRKALEAGMQEGGTTIEKTLHTTQSSHNLFGTRDALRNNYLSRAVAARIGMYGNTKEEAYYYSLWTDADKQPLDCVHHRYVMHFAKNQLPPVNAFWSITLYDANNQFLVTNLIHRYLINSYMLPELMRDTDGGLSLYLQHNEPTKEKVSNWLPAPAGPLFLVLRLYWPKENVLDGTWQPPLIRKI